MWIIDRFEGIFAVIEAEDTFFNIPKSALPKDAKEGDCLTVCIDKDSTAQRMKTAQDLMKKLFEK